MLKMMASQPYVPYAPELKGGYTYAPIYDPASYPPNEVIYVTGGSRLYLPGLYRVGDKLYYNGKEVWIWVGLDLIFDTGPGRTVRAPYNNFTTPSLVLGTDVHGLYCEFVSLDFLFSGTFVNTYISGVVHLSFITTDNQYTTWETGGPRPPFALTVPIS